MSTQVSSSRGLSYVSFEDFGIKPFIKLLYCQSDSLMIFEGVKILTHHYKATSNTPWKCNACIKGMILYFEIFI